MTTHNETHGLSDNFGSDLILADENDNEEHYRIVTEIEIDQQHYAVLQLHGDPDEEAYVFRVIPDGEELVVEDVEDDDEWERVAEVYCSMLRRQ